MILTIILHLIFAYSSARALAVTSNSFSSLCCSILIFGLTRAGHSVCVESLWWIDVARFTCWL